jgi:hypothetical protein
MKRVGGLRADLYSPETVCLSVVCLLSVCLSVCPSFSLSDLPIIFKVWVQTMILFSFSQLVWFVERELFLAYLVFRLFQSLVCSTDQDKQKYLAMNGK